MPDLNFEVEGAAPIPFAETPQLNFQLRITDAAGAEALPIPAVALRCQIRIEPTRRRYGPTEQEHLLDLFGEPTRWGQTLRSMLWTHTSLIVPPFTGRTLVDLPVPCSYDFNIAANKYFYALEDGVVQLSLLFSGTIFHTADPDGTLQVSPISWEKRGRVPAPGAGLEGDDGTLLSQLRWLCLRQDVFDQIYLYKSRLGLPTWEQAMERLLDSTRERVER